ncbi:MAG: hypothetical protein EA388_01270 [Nitriliruptor sp.]|nr:MAG: hypothetical protein EA388_01270 [Nitriliruptor sp.]
MTDAVGSTRRGAAAIEAAIEEFDLRTRLDEPDGSMDRLGNYDLAWARDRIDAARRAADADIVTSEEALAWLAAEVGRELPEDDPEEAMGLPPEDDR